MRQQSHFPLLVFLVAEFSRFTAVSVITSNNLTIREQIVGFKTTWCHQRIRRYEWNSLLRPCLPSIHWESDVWNCEYSTDASQSFVKSMKINPSGFFSEIVIQSVSAASTNKTIGGDSWRVNIRGPSNMAVPVYDNNDGSYLVVFLVTEPGGYRADIMLDYTACNGYRDPPRDWFSRGCRHGSFQPPGSLRHRINDFLNEPLGGGEGIVFEVPAAVNPFIPELETFKINSQVACKEKCNLLWDGFGSWTNERWMTFQTGLPVSLSRSGHQQGRGVLWVYGDSINRYFYEALLRRPLCWSVFRACYHTMLWVYVLTRTAKEEMDLANGGKNLNIPMILSELRAVVSRADMDEASVLVLNAGVHLLKSASFYQYQEIINGFVYILKNYYRGTVVWKSTTSVHDQQELYSGCFRRFHTEQRVQLFNSYATSVMCKAGFLVLDVYPLSSSYPGGTLDGVHYQDSVFDPVIDVLETYFQT